MITLLIKASVQELTPYQSARKIGGNGTIWLNANEYPTSPNILGLGTLNRYPEPQPDELIRRYARYAGVRPEQVLATRGGDEAIELIIRTFCEPTDSVLYCPPTYGMYAVSSTAFDIRTKTVPLTDDFNLDLPQIQANLDGTKVVFVCSPNNPTGNLLAHDDILALLAMTKDRAIVALDEAYIDFCVDKSFAHELDNFDNLIIVRTLSKAFGLAGIRCGFALANSQIISAMQKIIAPYPIPAPTALIATTALSDDGIGQMQTHVKTTLDNKAWLVRELESLPIVKAIYPSSANFILVKFDNQIQSGQAVFDKLWETGIILRNQTTALNLADCIRISIGTQDENQAVIDALKTL